MSRSLRSLQLLSLFALAVACSGGEASTNDTTQTEERVAQVRTLALEPRTVQDRVSLPADVLPLRRAVLAAEVPGAVESVRADLGQRVGAGSLLTAIDERSLAQRVAETEALLRDAELEFERAENLLSRRAITKAKWISAQTALDVARARLAAAKLDLDKARVSAPWGGSIAARFVEVGDYVTPGTPLFELVDASRVKVRAPARAADVPFLEVGRQVEVRLDAFPNEVFVARIERLGAQLDTASRTLDVEAEIANPDGRLKPGMLARLEVPRRELADALVVPMKAVVDLGESKAVYVVEDGRASRKPVTLGPVVGEEVVVDGLTPGTRIIVEGLHVVSDGQRVEEA